ncbi:MAG: HAD family hydrolase [Candidatus Paceibacterota bacterium]|jgi:phosphoglycolate phosphatase-like HAD superfamily hydrolase
MKPKVIIFDMDGVIFDSVPFAEKFLAVLYPGITVKMHREALCGNVHDGLAKLNISKLKETEEEMNLRYEQYAKDKLSVSMFDGMKKLLTDFYSRGYTLVLNTSAYRANCVPLLEKAGILNLFDFVGTVETSKSKVEKFEMIKNKYSVDGDDILFITDTLGDVKEAKIVNVSTIAVTWGAHDRGYFARERCDNLVKIVDTVDELAKFIYGQFA